MQWTTVRTLVAAVAGGLVVCSGSAGASPSVCDAASGNLVQNCGFETGLTNWNSDFQGGFVASQAANSGNLGLIFDSESGLLPLSQILTTTPGTEYTISFMVDGSGTSEVSLSWGDTQIADIANIPNQWIQHSFTETANAGSTVLTFGLADSQSAGFLDDIIVTANAVPEPSSLSILAAVLVGLGLMRHQRVVAGPAGPQARTQQKSRR